MLGRMVAIINFMTGPEIREVTVRMTCPHAIHEMRLPDVDLADLGQANRIADTARELAELHWQSFDRSCQPQILVNGEETVQ
jgi:hypothetical protein